MIKKLIFRFGTVGMTARWVARKHLSIMRESPETPVSEAIRVIALGRYLADPGNPKLNKILALAGSDKLTRLTLAILRVESVLEQVDFKAKYLCREVVEEELAKNGIAPELIYYDEYPF